METRPEPPRRGLPPRMRSATRNERPPPPSRNLTRMKTAPQRPIRKPMARHRSPSRSPGPPPRSPRQSPSSMPNFSHPTGPPSSSSRSAPLENSRKFLSPIDASSNDYSIMYNHELGSPGPERSDRKDSHTSSDTDEAGDEQLVSSADCGNSSALSTPVEKSPLDFNDAEIEPEIEEYEPTVPADNSSKKKGERVHRTVSQELGDLTTGGKASALRNKFEQMSKKNKKERESGSPKPMPMKTNNLRNMWEQQTRKNSQRTDPEPLKRETRMSSRAVDKSCGPRASIHTPNKIKWSNKPHGLKYRTIIRRLHYNLNDLHDQLNMMNADVDTNDYRILRKTNLHTDQGLLKSIGVLNIHDIVEVMNIATETKRSTRSEQIEIAFVRFTQDDTGEEMQGYVRVMTYRGQCIMAPDDADILDFANRVTELSDMIKAVEMIFERALKENMVTSKEEILTAVEENEEVNIDIVREAIEDIALPEKASQKRGAVTSKLSVGSGVQDKIKRYRSISSQAEAALNRSRSRPGRLTEEEKPKMMKAHSRPTFEDSRERFDTSDTVMVANLPAIPGPVQKPSRTPDAAPLKPPPFVPPPHPTQPPEQPLKRTVTCDVPKLATLPNLPDCPIDAPNSLPPKSPTGTSPSFPSNPSNRKSVPQGPEYTPSNTRSTISLDDSDAADYLPPMLGNPQLKGAKSYSALPDKKMGGIMASFKLGQFPGSAPTGNSSLLESNSDSRMVRPPNPSKPKSRSDKLKWMLGESTSPPKVTKKKRRRPPRLEPLSFCKPIDVVERVSHPHAPSHEYKYVLFLSHSAYIRTPDLLNLFEQRYLDPPVDIYFNDDDDEEYRETQRPRLKKTIQIKVCSVLKYWFLSFPEDFQDDEDVEEAKRIIQEISVTSQKLAQQLQDAIDKRHVQMNQPWDPHNCPPLKRFDSNNINIMTVSCEEISRQFCISDFILFRRIVPREFISYVTGKRDDCAHLDAMIKRFNAISSWTQAVILYPPNVTPQKRANTISRLLRIMQYLDKMNNLHALHAIYGGLKKAAIHRLKKSWGQLSKAQLKIMERFDELFAAAGGSQNLKQRTKTLPQPAIPQVAIFLGDLTFIQDGNKNTKEGLVNMKKYKLFSAQIEWINMFQQSSYSFTRVEQIENYMKQMMKFVPEDMFWTLSNQYEPREKRR